MIRFDEVSKRFTGQIAALDTVSVEIQDGEFVFLIGSSGAGKTTILRLLLREMLPSHGKIYVDDMEINKLSAQKIYVLRRKIGMVFQDFKLLFDRTIFENVALGLEIRGKKEKEIQKRVAEVLELVGIADKRNIFPQQLSAGELQRASIARAIVGGPSILLADEPTGNLDPQTSWEIVRILQEINAVGTTVIMATHNVHLVDEVKKRTITMEHGKIIRDSIKGGYVLSQAHHKHK